MTGKRGSRGTVLLEGVLAFLLLTPALLLSVEWARRGCIDVAMAGAACAIARDVRWGLRRELAFSRARPLLVAAVGGAGARSVQQQSQPLIERRARGVVARLHLRAPLLWRFQANHQSRHHFEVTHQCLSP